MGCNSLPVPDVPICTEINFSKGACAWTVSEKEQIVTDETPILIDKKKYTWWELRGKTLQVPVSSWVKIKEFILKTCEKYPDQCVSNVQKKINYLDESMRP